MSLYDRPRDRDSSARYARHPQSATSGRPQKQARAAENRRTPAPNGARTSASTLRDALTLAAHDAVPLGRLADSAPLAAASAAFYLMQATTLAWQVGEVLAALTAESERAA